MARRVRASILMVAAMLFVACSSANVRYDENVNFKTYRTFAVNPLPSACRPHPSVAHER